MATYAVIGVHENIGREILNFMEEDGIKKSDVIAVDINSPLGTQVSYGEDYELDVLNLESFDFKKADIVIFATSKEIAKRFLPKAISANVKIVDASGYSFSDSDVPMIIAGINDHKISSAKRNIVSVPSASVTQLLIPLKKIDENYHIKRIVLTAFTSTSVYGNEAMDELFSQTRKIFMNESLVDDQKIFNKQIAFNLIPQVGEFIGEETSFEWAVNAETKKILHDDIKIHANFAVVPAFIGEAQYVNVECEKEIDVDEARKLIKQTKGVIVFDKNTDGGYVSLADVQGENDIYISRMRQDVSVDNGISFWCVADNLRAAAAQNTFAVARLLLKA